MSMAIRVCEFGFIVLVILQSIVAKSVDPTKLQVIPARWVAFIFRGVFKTLLIEGKHSLIGLP